MSKNANIEVHYKIIFSGPVGAGKTTAINSVSDKAPIKTEQLATDDSKDLKEKTTVALDYGSIVLQPKTMIHLYGTPGQKRFDFMWDILTNGGIGLILLIDGSSDKALENLRFFLDSFEDFTNKTTVVVGVTKQDENKPFKLQDYLNVLKPSEKSITISAIDARKKDDVASLVYRLLFSLDTQ
jgi:signal recognition particle receptor subunit beta